MSDFYEGEYASKWGLTDFYPEAEESLKKLIASGEDFATNFGCKKEIRYASYVRKGDTMTISVMACMDDLYESDDLIYDALWEAFKREIELTDAEIDAIRSEAIEVGIEDSSTESSVIVGNITYDAVIKETERLEDEVERQNTEMFNRLVETVKEHCEDSLRDAAKEGFEADLDMGFDPYLGCYTDDV